ncbi:MAG: biopolymer transporter ExbD [Kordiimonadaceae bacterium]|nr:biopolymer transporter ExbD [Kordiimonadaceae bacterium]
MKRVSKRTKMEPVISLINIVFLILIFFMVTGTLSRHNDGGLTFVQTTGLECCSEPDALRISREGELSYKGAKIATLGSYFEVLEGKFKSVKLLPDQELSAHQLLGIISEVQKSGAENIVILTQNLPQ